MVSLNEALKPAEILIVDSEPHHCALLVPRIRKGDLIEIEEMGLSPKRAVYRSYRMSFYRKTAFIDGEIAGMAGFAGDFFGENAVPWMLTTDLVEQHPIHFMRVIREHFRRGVETFPTLKNRVAADYTQAIKLIKWLGFEVGEPELMPTGNYTRTFTYKRPAECALHCSD